MISTSPCMNDGWCLTFSSASTAFFLRWRLMYRLICRSSRAAYPSQHCHLPAATEAQPALWFNLCWYRCTSTWSPTHRQSVFKRYHSDVHFSRVLPTRWRQKSTGTDMKENYVPVALCINSVGATALRDRWDACLPTSNDTRSYFNVRSKADMSRSA